MENQKRERLQKLIKRHKCVISIYVLW